MKSPVRLIAYKCTEKFTGADVIPVTKPFLMTLLLLQIVILREKKEEKKWTLYWMMYGDIACIQRIESIITLNKIGYEIQLRNQPLNSLVFIMYQ